MSSTPAGAAVKLEVPPVKTGASGAAPLNGSSANLAGSPHIKKEAPAAGQLRQQSPLQQQQQHQMQPQQLQQAQQQQMQQAQGGVPPGRQPVLQQMQQASQQSVGQPMKGSPRVSQGQGQVPVKLQPQMQQAQMMRQQQQQQQMRQQMAMQQPQQAAPSQQQQPPVPLQQGAQYSNILPQQTAAPSVSWQSEADLPQRRKMITKIVSLLQQRKPNAPNDWVKKLPDMARRLEDSLYRTASSADEYGNFNTLKHRLQQLALSMGARAAKKTSQQAQQQQGQASPQTQQQQPAQQQPVVPKTEGSDGRKVMVNMQDINPMMNPAPAPGQVANGSMQRQGNGSQMQQAAMQQAPKPAAQVKQQGQQKSSQPTPTPEQRQHVLRQQQQRLLLLRHASKCPAPEGSCRATPHCAAMKQLWAHIAKCKDQRCQVSHCVSSRYVLSHYHRCKDSRCAVCGPVREAIQRHHERAKVVAEEKMKAMQMRQLKQGGVGGQQKRQQKRPGPGTARPSKKTKREPGSSQVVSQGYHTHLTGDRKQLQEGTSLINTFDNKLINDHITSLRKHFNPLQTAAQLKSKLLPLLKKLSEHKYGFIFAQPVDPVALNIPDYFTIITSPMDLGTCKKRLEAGQYKHSDEFAVDVHLTFDNAIKYNEDQSPVNAVAKELKGNFELMYAKVVAEMKEEEKRRREGVDACRLCGGEKFLYEPVVFYCNGPCASRVRRNSYYYTCRENKHHWCHQCWTEIKEDRIELPGVTLRKKELIKKKNDEVHEEGWVQCETCNRWVHQICALFNGRNNASSAAYHCPVCVMEYRKAGNTKFKTQPPAAAASDLKGTKCGDFIEKRVHEMLKKRRESEAKRLGKKPEEIVTADNISIKMVLNVEKTLTVGERIHERYKDSHEYPPEFAYRSRCILMFQTLNGVDVLLYGMYVHEFGEECPEPNCRRVYVSYLDTVKYMHPPQLRTPIYHEILQAYLEYARKLGHHTAHIWACPPLKGDDYILYCKPEDQKTPKPERLRAWYIKMLEDIMMPADAKPTKPAVHHTVLNLSDLYADFFKGPLPVTAARLPYFKGDYWLGVADDLLKTMEDEKKDNVNKAKKKQKQKQTKKGKKSGTRSSGPVPEIIDDNHDELMDKLGEVLQPMKEDFIVVWMREKCRQCHKAICSKVWQDVEDEKYHLCEACYTKMKAKSASEQHPRGQAAVHEFKEKHPALGKSEEPDPEVTNEHFDTRQAFLSLCQGNHYQFDQLRRAKHSSMMVLYHLHNPDAPRFVHSCSACQSDIAQGLRYHCNTCNDYDLCQNCYTKVKHHHPLTVIKVGATKEQNAQDAAARRDRARSIQLHMQLLVHASGCVNQACPSANCSKMKALLKHGATCTMRATGGCHICRRIWALLQIHARQCRQQSCPVPRCRDLKEHLRRLQRQQAAMESRRRQAVTARYAQSQSPRG